jgi:hypothetical protein
MTYYSDDDISLVLHRLHYITCLASEVLHRTIVLQDFLDIPQWHAFAHAQAYIDFMHANPTHIHESYESFERGA